MAENYKHLYEQTKKMLTMYQDEIVPGLRKLIDERVVVVRCKGCKFFHDKGYCTKITGLTRIKPDDFCSHGERKDNEDNRSDDGTCRG
jgi:hypothetical protein